MFEENERKLIATEIAARIGMDRKLLDKIVDDLRKSGVKGSVRQIRPYSTTTLAIVASDGGNARFRFDPFEHQVVRIVDSDGQTLALRPVTTSTDLDQLFKEDTSPLPDGRMSPLGVLKGDLERATGNVISSFHSLCPSIGVNPDHPERQGGWVLSYRDLWEWAVLYERITRTTFAQSTLIIRDGLLRTKLFSDPYFRVIGDLLAERLRDLKLNYKKDVYLVGVAKHSSVVDLYHLGFALENIFPEGHPYYVPIERKLEINAYKFPEFARGRERLQRGPDGLAAFRDPATGGLVSRGVKPTERDVKEDSKFVFGSMFLARFAPELAMPTWAIDIFDDQVGDVDRIIGHLFMDAINGFPVPCYPLSLQRAHDAAKLTNFDTAILDKAIMDGIRRLVKDETIIDRLQLSGDLAGRRY